MSNKEVSDEIEKAFQDFLISVTKTMKENMLMEPELKHAIKDLVEGAYDKLAEVIGAALKHDRMEGNEHLWED